MEHVSQPSLCYPSCVTWQTPWRSSNAPNTTAGAREAALGGFSRWLLPPQRYWGSLATSEVVWSYPTGLHVTGTSQDVENWSSCGLRTEKDPSCVQTPEMTSNRWVLSQHAVHARAHFEILFLREHSPACCCVATQKNCCNSYKVESTDSKYVEMYWIFCIEFTFVMLGLGVMVKLHYSTWAVWLSLSSSYQQNHANISNLSNCGDSWSHYSGTGMGQARLWKLCGTWAKW